MASFYHACEVLGAVGFVLSRFTELNQRYSGKAELRYKNSDYAKRSEIDDDSVDAGEECS
jgi:hypothetical protein